MEHAYLPSVERWNERDKPRCPTCTRLGARPRCSPRRASLWPLGIGLSSVYLVGRRSLTPIIVAHALVDLAIEPWLLLSVSAGVAIAAITAEVVAALRRPFQAQGTLGMELFTAWPAWSSGHLSGPWATLRLV